MLTVDHYELSRRKVLIEGKSQRVVAKELGHSRKTVAKALELCKGLFLVGTQINSLSTPCYIISLGMFVK